MVTYYAVLTAEAGVYSVVFPDLPYGATQGETVDEALSMAEDFLASALEIVMRKGLPLPAPSRPRGRMVRPITLPVLPSAKVELYRAFREAGLQKAEFARRLGISKTNIDRLFDPHHTSRMDQIEAAFRVLGKRLTIGLEQAA